ncbi:MAG: PQQ-binding-like beta-propeller repeat protein [Methanomassiliicoccales archaeon]|nr:MAG: PQQ-binding-like beta-propeller repeat protein [Methanomassiliicoccales archaeon]
MFRGDILHSGIFDSTVPENNSLFWSFDTGAPIESSPVVVGNWVYFGCENGKVYCVDAETGDEEWNFTTKNEVDSTPTVVDGVVYVGSADTNLYAIEADSGHELWNYSPPSPLAQITPSPAVANNMIFFGASDYNIYAVNATSHEMEWVFPVKDDVWSSPAVNWPYVYIGSLDGNLYCLWAENGTENWNFSTNLSKSPRGIYCSPMISNGRLYIGSEDYNLYCLDAETGDFIWNFTAPYYIYSSAAVHDGLVFIHTQGKPYGHIYALPENDPNAEGVIDESEIVWSFETKDFDGGSSPSVADGMVLVGSNIKVPWPQETIGKLYCFNETTGKELWNLTTEKGIVASPFIANGVVYITSKDGTLYAVGGMEPAEIEITILPEFSTIKAGRVMGISFLVTYRDEPMEGAFIKVDVTHGTLWQGGASTFSDGTQRIKYTAPDADENLTVTLHATVTKSGYPEIESSAQFIVEPSSSYEDIGSGSVLSITKYWAYIFAIGALIAVNVILIVVRGKKGNPTTKKDEMKKEVRD